MSEPKAFITMAEYHPVDMTVRLRLQDGGWWSVPRDTLQERANEYAITKARHGHVDFRPIYADIFMNSPHLFEFTGRRDRIPLRSTP